MHETQNVPSWIDFDMKKSSLVLMYFVGDVLTECIRKVVIDEGMICFALCAH